MVQLTFPSRTLEPQAPAQLMAECLTWIENNRHAWKLIYISAVQDAAHIGRVRVKRYIEDARYLVLASGDRPRIPNAYTPAIGRLLGEWYPELAPFIPLASSKLDGLSAVPCPTWARSL